MNYYNMLLSHLGIGKSINSMEKVSFEIVLKGKKQIAAETYEFIFEKQKNFHFNAGQHIRMTLLNPSETDSKDNSRFLTLANTPEEKDLIVAMRMTDSAFKRVLGKMRIGEKVMIQILLHSPHGSFVIHDDTSRPAVFLVGGIGIVPAYSMIKEAIEKKLKHMIFLFYSNRRPEDAPYLHELKKLAMQNSNFKLIATMTEPEKADHWEGKIGHIDKAMLKRYIKDLNPPIYYIAGLTNMVNAMKKLLKDVEINEENIHSEDFSGFKMGLINIANKTDGNKKYLFAGIALIITIVIVVHIIAAFSLFNSETFKNLSYLAIGQSLSL